MARTGILALVGAWAGLMIGAQPAGAQTVDAPTARTQAWASDLAAIVAADTGAVPPRLPTTAFAALPPFRQPQLSPDGLRFAAIVSSHGREDVVIVDVTGATKTVELGLSSEFELQSYRWAGNGTLLISVGKAAEWRNDDALMTRLIAYDLASKSEKFIGSSAEGMIGDDVLWVAPDGKRILLAYQRDVSSYPSVFSVDLATNKSTVAADAINHIWYWHADTDGVVRSGFGYTDGALQAGSNLNAAGHWLAVYRKTATEPFHPIAVDSADDPDPFGDGAEIAGGSDTGLTLGTDAKTGFTAVYAFDFSRLKRGDPVFEAPSSDIADFDATDDGKALRAAWYVEDRPRVKWGDDEMQAFQANLDKAVNHDNPDGGYIAQVISHNANYDRRIVWVGAANDPGYYYFYQQVNGKMDRMAALNPALPPAALATPHYVHYTARDGLSIPAYLTLPKGRSAKGLPLIILPMAVPSGYEMTARSTPMCSFSPIAAMRCCSRNSAARPPMARPSMTRARASGAAPCRTILMTAWTGLCIRAWSIQSAYASWDRPTAAMPRSGVRRAIRNATAAQQALPASPISSASSSTATTSTTTSRARTIGGLRFKAIPAST